MRKYIATIIILVSVSGCVKNPPYEEAVQTRYHPFIGQSVGDFISSTGETLVSSFDRANGKKTFIFEHINPIGSCRHTVETIHTGKTVTVDDFTIESITSQGGCLY